ncbi:heparan-alpha-glucosaminide N-acetyltransferase isoform X3 [Eublepharis macularius]|uniref:Heparan-alpha-glucosaminide N-acetyltransferase isoform X3 n=1 Tax=Eublepharis macularius TaxID=481883 RepID=A0AA97LA21_EUBMA|nr:heparan-alpha-glucosaminide N-acetyltransferase isoform X3 [Eublepharis macularius]
MAGRRLGRWGSPPWGALAALAAALLLRVRAQPPEAARRQGGQLRVDQAWLRVRGEGLAEAATVSWRSEACFQCLFQELASLAPNGTVEEASVAVDCQHGLALRVSGAAEGQELCRAHYHFGEFGNYSLIVKSDPSSQKILCNIVINQEPVNSYLPIFFAFLIYMGTFALLALGQFCVNSIEPIRNWLYVKMNPRETDRLINSELGSPRRTDSISSGLPPGVWSPGSTIQRLRSLDTFRGLALTIMVFVNYGGGKYWFFKHQSWNGLTVADLVFPWFVFIMGTSTALSLSSMLRRGCSKRQLLLKILWRSFLLILIGVVVVNPNYCLGPLSWDNLRIPGVLQRLGCTYLVVAGLELLFAKPVPDSTSVVLYMTTVAFDPEGVLGTINSVILAFLGLQGGKILLLFKDQPRQIMLRFCVWSVIMGVISAVLTKCSKEDGFIPVNKNLWSVSYVTTLSSFAFILLLLIYYLVDVKRVWSGAPFFFPGMNSILVYVGHEIFENYFPFKWKMRGPQSHSEHLAQNLIATSLWVVISYGLYQKRIFWKI